MGVELDVPEGVHDGTVLGDAYFECKPKSGVFCQPTQLQEA